MRHPLTSLRISSDDNLTASYDENQRIYAALRRLDALFNRIEGPTAASLLRRREAFLPFLYPCHCPDDSLQELDGLLHAEAAAPKSPNYKVSTKKGGSPKVAKGVGKDRGEEEDEEEEDEEDEDEDEEEEEEAAAAAVGSISDADKETDKEKEKEEKAKDKEVGEKAEGKNEEKKGSGAGAAPSPDGKAAALAAAAVAAAEAVEAARKGRDRERDRKIEYHRARVLDGTVSGDLRKLLGETLGDSECMLVFFTPCAGPSGSNFKVRLEWALI